MAHRRPVSQSIRADQKSYHKFETHLAVLQVGLWGEDFFIENVTTGELVRLTPDDLAGLATGQYYKTTDGTTKQRFGTRDGKWVVDEALTELGFDGVENVDWEYRGGIG